VTNRSLQMQMIGRFKMCGGFLEFFLAGTSWIKLHRLRMKPWNRKPFQSLESV
jgi:hypothetical protein